MPYGYPVPSNGAALAGALFQPHSNFAARSAQRQEAVQIGGILAAQEEQKAAQAQAAQSQADAFLAQANSLPFLGKDKQKLGQYMKGEEKALYERLRDNYGGDLRRWQQAEGSSWMQGVAQRLQSSPFYQQASQNRLNVLTAQEARKKGEYLVGSQQGNAYQSGEQQLSDFLSGKTDTYDHRGSYKPEDDLKELRGMNAPGRLPWERVQVSEEDKLAHLVNQYGAEVGKDKYLRQHAGVSTYYRTAPITDAIKFGQDNARFGMEQGRYRMAQEDQSMQRTAFRSSEGLKAKQGQLLDAKIAEKNGLTANNERFDHNLLKFSDGTINLKHDPSAPKKLSSGLDIGNINSLSGITLYNNAESILEQKLGLQKTKDGYGRGSFKGAFTNANGVNAIDLSKSNFTTVGVDPTLYVNSQDVNASGYKKNLHGFGRVTVKFDSDDDAERAGLFTNHIGSWFDSDTKIGAGLYDPSTREATIFVGTGELNSPFFKAIQQKYVGTKPTNEGTDAQVPFLDTGF